MTLLDRLSGRRRADGAGAAVVTAPTSTPRFTSPAQRDADLSGWRNRAAGVLLPGFDAPAGSVVLDVGCGEAPHAAFFAGDPVEIIVADILPESVTAAASAIRRVGAAATVTALVTDTDPLPLPDCSADRIIATEVLEHVPDPVQFLSELVRVGRPGAKYLLAVPDQRSESLQAPFAAPDYFAPPNHVRVFSDEAFDTLIRDAGLLIEHKQYDGFYQSLWWSFFWISAQPEPRAPWTPLLEHWMRTWDAMLELDRGPALKRELDRRIPKSQVVVAVKAD